MKSRDVIRKLKDEDWYVVNSEGPHLQLKHPEMPGHVTVPHPKTDIPGTLKSIEQQAGMSLK